MALTPNKFATPIKLVSLKVTLRYKPIKDLYILASPLRT